MKRSELKQFIKEEISKASINRKYNVDEVIDLLWRANSNSFPSKLSIKNWLKIQGSTLSESQKIQTQQEMDQLLEDGKTHLKKIQQLMKSKGYEI